MTLADLQKYIALVIEAYTLEQSIQMNPASIITDLPKLKALYDEIRALASTHQAAAEDMAASIVGNQTVLVDTKPVVQPPLANDPYSQNFATVDQAKAQGRAGDKVYDTHQGDFRLVYGGAGGAVNPAWTLVETLP